MRNNGDTVPHWDRHRGHTDKRQLVPMVVFWELCIASLVKKHPVVLFPFAKFVYITRIDASLCKEN